ncbi:phosphotransferase enzyme family protein [Ilumatobacter sp.]|uniref:phosphotransferase enzyme family protein n=1 Tax=Ilumatobacter sp. TaxID=1967498 RepID=UPI003B52DCD9
MTRAFVDRPVGDHAAARRVAVAATERWGLGTPTPLRTAMNAIFTAGGAVVRVSAPSVPAVASIHLARSLAERGVPVPAPVRDDVVEVSGLSATAWERVEDTGRPVDWHRTGEVVRAVHSIDPADLPDGVPCPSPTDLPWWRHDEMLDELAPTLDAAAVDGLRAAIERHRGWGDLEGADLVTCHGDVHPGNVIMSPDGPVLLDWDLLCVAPRGWDHAPLMTWTERWGGRPGIYDEYSGGYGWSARGDRHAEAFAELRLVSATLMRWKAATVDPAALAEAELRLAHWRGDPDARVWGAQ